MELALTRAYHADVVVVGGGTAGVFAAISAARCGVKVLLIEKSGMLGGTVTVASVNFPGLFFAWGEKIISGPCWEAIERTVALGGATLPEITFHPAAHYHEQILLNRFVYSTVLCEMCREAGVQVLTGSMLSAIEEIDEGVSGIVTDKCGMAAFSAGAAIDATGDANLISIAGYPLEKSAVQQPATLQNHMSGYDLEAVDQEGLRAAVEAAELPAHIGFAQLLHCLHIHKLDLHVPCRDADSSIGRTALEAEARLFLLKLYTMLRQVKGLENLTIDFVAEETGVRETCRIVGETVITAEDYLAGKVYEDAVCYAFYPIDLHVMNGIKQSFLAEHVVPTIPYGALIPKNSRRLFCAGRCISSDTDANSAIRVQAVCMATGQAAGCAAALCSKNQLDSTALSYEDLTAALTALGAIVPKK